MPERNLEDEDNEEVRRIRRVRQELYGRFKTSDELFAWLRQREKEAGPRLIYRAAKVQTIKKTKPAVRNGKQANGKAIRNSAIRGQST